MAARLDGVCVCVCVWVWVCVCVVCGELCVDVCMWTRNCIHMFGVSACCAVDVCSGHVYYLHQA